MSSFKFTKRGEYIMTKSIASKIKSLRQECGWNQSKLARQSGVTAPAISMIESGKRGASFVVVRKISDALKVSVSELTGESTQEDADQHAKAFFRKFGDLIDLDESEQKIILDLAESLKQRRNEMLGLVNKAIKEDLEE